MARTIPLTPEQQKQLLDAFEKANEALSLIPFATVDALTEGLKSQFRAANSSVAKAREAMTNYFNKPPESA